MRKAGRSGRTVVLRLRFADFTRATRSVTLPYATFHSGDGSGQPLAGCWPRRLPLIEERGCTLLGLAVANLDDSPQLMLPLETNSSSALDAAVDEVRARFGMDVADARRPPRPPEAGVHGAAAPD